MFFFYFLMGGLHCYVKVIAKRKHCISRGIPFVVMYKIYKTMSAYTPQLGEGSFQRLRYRKIIPSLVERRVTRHCHYVTVVAELVRLSFDVAWGFV
uniref:Putative secreted protein n=1 Tax=Ixodes ricinus TaxID=34613 RepID=A0A6B0UDI8_IXORI